MKTFIETLAFAALALSVLGAPVFVADASFADPGVVRCQVCGLQYRVKTNVTKEKSIRVNWCL
jgi:hypothetical protein